MTEAVKKGIQEFKSCMNGWSKWRDPKLEHDLLIAETAMKDLIDEEVRKHWNTYLNVKKEKKEGKISLPINKNTTNCYLTTC